MCQSQRHKSFWPFLFILFCFMAFPIESDRYGRRRRSLMMTTRSIKYSKFEREIF
jgi:hypothetical protein